MVNERWGLAIPARSFASHASVCGGLTPQAVRDGMEYDQHTTPFFSNSHAVDKYREPLSTAKLQDMPTSVRNDRYLLFIS